MGCSLLFSWGRTFSPLKNPNITGAIVEAFKLLQRYARNHTRACVVPAFFIAGGITTFLSKEIASLDVKETWVTRVHAICWTLAGSMGLAVLFMPLVLPDGGSRYRF